MLTGYFQLQDDTPNPRPYLSGFIEFSSIGVAEMKVEFLIDTGADTSLIGDFDAFRMVRDFGVDLTDLQSGPPSEGIGGVVEMRTADATLRLDDFTKNLRIDILEPSPGAQFAVPSLLGRDVLAHFALFVEERTRKVLLLEPAEADALGLE